MFLNLNLKALILKSILIASCFSFGAHADNRHYSHDSSHRKVVSHHYVYYPQHQAYYSPSSHMWHWNSGNKWRSSRHTPSYMHIDFRVAGIPIQLQSALPYYEHAYVINKYAQNKNHYQHRDHYYEDNRYHKYKQKKRYQHKKRHDYDD